jgi:hypothetical protein
MANNAVDADAECDHASSIEAVMGLAEALRGTAGSIRSAEDLQQFEMQVREVADRLHLAMMKDALQAAVRSPAVVEASRALVADLPRRLRSDGLQRVSVQTARGAVVEVETTYYRERSRVGNKRRPGLYPSLVVLGIWDRCTPTLASDVSRSVAMLGSLAEAKAHLAAEGIDLDVKTIRSIAYRYAARARTVQASKDYRWGESAAGRRVVISLDGGRVRVRRKKRGPKTKKGRTRFKGAWEEPKLLIVYVVGSDGRPLSSWAPVIDGTLRGPDVTYAMLLSYARQLEIARADRILFVADGAPWIFLRFAALVAELHLQRDQVIMLIDFYHAAKQLSDAVKLRRWSQKRQTRWLNRQRHLLRRGDIDAVICALEEMRQGAGRNATAVGTHLGYFLSNYKRFAYQKVHRLGFPMGSGAMESAIRRVVNLRIKGNSIYWLAENVEAILLLRSFYKAGRWHDLQRMAVALETAA